MATDIKLDQGPGGNWLVLEGAVVHATATDVLLDAPRRRRTSGGLRRALVHDETDGLTINYSGDYPGGVTVVGLNVDTLRLEVREQSGSTPRLPKAGRVGDLVAIRSTTFQDVGGRRVPIGEEVTLWLCVSVRPSVTGDGGTASWKQVQLGSAVTGTE